MSKNRIKDLIAERNTIIQSYDPILGFRGLPDNFFVQTGVEIPLQTFMDNTPSRDVRKSYSCAKPFPRRHGQDNRS